MEVSSRAVLTSAVAALVAVTAFVDELALAGTVAFLALVAGLGWPRLLRVPSRVGSGVVVALAGVGSVAAVWAASGGPLLGHMALVVALAVLLAFVNELARQDGRRRLVESVSGTVSGVVVVASGAGWVASIRTPPAASLVVAGSAALAVASAASAVHLGARLGAAVTIVAGVIAGGAVGFVMPVVELLPGAVLGLAVGLLVAVMHAMLVGVPSLRRRMPALTAVVLPVLVCGTLVYVVGRVMVA